MVLGRTTFFGMSAVVVGMVSRTAMVPADVLSSENSSSKNAVGPICAVIAGRSTVNVHKDKAVLLSPAELCLSTNLSIDFTHLFVFVVSR